MKNLFTSASLKLTAWYLIILMIISLLFSFILYNISIGELRRSLRDPGPNRSYFGLFLDADAARQLRESRYNESRDHLVVNLAILNIATLVAGGGVSYLLARRTLKPIESAVEAQGRFTSDASHELRTPLAVMKSEIEVGLRDTSAKKKDLQALLRSNLEEVDRLHELSDRLLLLASEQDLPLESVPLQPVVYDAVKIAQVSARKRSIKIENTVGPFMVRANQEAMKDALGILLDNAIKYSNDHTSIGLHTNQTGKTVALSVVDQGRGISKQHILRVFDRFYRVDESRSKQNVEGHGLGLSIAKRIIEQHHARITVESEPQKGTKFTIHLPIA